jgi:hypothetical protein
MDSISDSDSEDAGSIPAGTTNFTTIIGAILKMQVPLLPGLLLSRCMSKDAFLLSVRRLFSWYDFH